MEIIDGSGVDTMVRDMANSLGLRMISRLRHLSDWKQEGSTEYRATNKQILHLRKIADYKADALLIKHYDYTQKMRQQVQSIKRPSFLKQFFAKRRTSFRRGES